MATRADVLERIAQLAGPEVLELESADAGWPGMGTVFIGQEPISVALYVGPVGLSQRGRDELERRFQNPGNNRPISDHGPSRTPLLLGLWESDDLLYVRRPVLVAADPYRRIGRATRYSVFADLPTLGTAMETGWAEDVNGVGEKVVCFFPELLSVVLESALERASPDPNQVRAALSSSGLLDPASPADLGEAAFRARRTVTTLVRNAGFGRRVVDAYGGACAMCGLDSGFSQGAHIYPVEAPGSTDRLSNGLALCPNHHHAFDRHLIGVEPASGAVLISGELEEAIGGLPAGQLFLQSTWATLAQPRLSAARPSPAMFARRYEYFAPSYDWL